MAENKKLKYIKTAQDLSEFNTSIKEYINRGKSYSELMDYVIDPDFDLDLFYKSQGYDAKSDDFYNMYFNLVSNTISGLNKKQKDEFANRLGDSLKSYWDLVYMFGGAEKWNRDDLQKRAKYSPYNIVFHAADKRDLFRDEAFLFKKTISPDNQVLLRNSGFVNPYEYNFSNQRMQDSKISMPFLPKGNTHGLYGNDKHLFEKFQKDFGRAFDPKTAFKNAQHPDVLFDLRSGKIQPSVAMSELNSSDFKYIIPKNDFKDLSASEIYDILSARDVRWEQWQVASMMEMIVDKSPDVNNEEYLNQIMEIIVVNNQLFLKQTENNHKLWLKIEDKFKNIVQQNKAYEQNLKDSIEKLRTEIKEKESDLESLKKMLSVLRDEKESYVSLERQLESFSHRGGDFIKNNVPVIKRNIDNTVNGKFDSMALPEKPWKIIAFPKEKKEYEELCALIANVNRRNAYRKNCRDNTFGEHEFNLTAKMNELGLKQRDIEFERSTRATVLNQQSLNQRSFYNSAKRISDNLEKNVGEQKNAKADRMQQAREKLKEKGVVLGQKSGVIEADKKAEKIIFDKAVEKMMKKLRATPANAKKSDKELMEIAKRLVSEKQK